MVSKTKLRILDEVSFVSYTIHYYSRMWFFWCFQGLVTFNLSQLTFVGRPDVEVIELITKKSLRTECTPEELEETITLRLLTLVKRKKKQQIKDK